MKKFAIFVLTMFSLVLFVACGNTASNIKEDAEQQSSFMISSSSDISSDEKEKTLSSVAKVDIEKGEGIVDYIISTNTKTLKIGDEIDFVVEIKTEDEAVLTGQVALQYDNKLLLIEDNNISTKDSVFSMWVEKKVNSSKGQILCTFAEPNPGINIKKGSVFSFKAKILKAGKININFIQNNMYANNKDMKNEVKDSLKGFEIVVEGVNEATL